jgi:membrane-bound ClpP family serine protease
MSMFGSLGLSRLPYMGWLLPVLIALMALHLVMLWRKVPSIGWRPLILSVAGCVTIAATRLLDVTTTWPVLLAMVMIISGSWLSSRVDCRSTR